MYRKECKLIVKELLENEIETRSDDDLLCALVDARVNPNIVNLPYFEVRENAARYGLYDAETITRIRRMLQEDHPELRGVDVTTRRRIRREKEFREFFRGRKNGDK